jgi:S1-C subfamily serine protease
MYKLFCLCLVLFSSVSNAERLVFPIEKTTSKVDNRPIYKNTTGKEIDFFNELYSISNLREGNKVTVVLYGPNKSPRCGGVLVSNFGLILTAAHCVLNEEAIADPFNFVEVQNEIYRATMVKLSRKHDLALLEITDKYCKVTDYVSIAKRLPEEEDLISILSGFGARTKYIWSFGQIGKADHNASSGEHTFLTTGADVWYGSSGSPVFNEEGELIGIISSFGPAGPGITLWMNAIHTIELQKFLKGVL